MKVLLVVFLVVANAYEFCNDTTRIEHLANGTCGDKNKVAVCLNKADAGQRYIGDRPARVPVNFDEMNAFRLLTHVEFKCPFNDTWTFHEAVVSHHVATHTHFLRTTSNSWMEIRNETMVVHNTHTNTNCTVNTTETHARRGHWNSPLHAIGHRNPYRL